jgi:hypothetical protein
MLYPFMREINVHFVWLISQIYPIEIATYDTGAIWREESSFKIPFKQLYEIFFWKLFKLYGHIIGVLVKS